MFDIGLSEMLIILVVALLVLGPKKLPEIARSLGRGLAEFRRTSEDIRRSVFEEDDHPKTPRTRNAGYKPPQAARERSSSGESADGVDPASSHGPPPERESTGTPSDKVDG